MALKPRTRKTVKPVVSAKAASTGKLATKKKTVVRGAKAPSEVTKKPVKVKATPAQRVDPLQKITFSYFAPQAGSVLVAGDFTEWSASPISLLKEEGGTWKTTVLLQPGRYQYRLLVDGQWQNDPGCPDLQPNDFGSANCVLSVAA